ncbi:hypothetical protein MY11210_009502 [Beauveria gryllotalpidicola]
MRCLVLLPVALCSLAQAQDVIAATLPRFYEIKVGNSNACYVYRDLNCIDEIKKFPEGRYDIESLDFKSIRCEDGDHQKSPPVHASIKFMLDSLLIGSVIMISSITATTGPGRTLVDCGVFAQPDFGFELMDTFDWLR